MKILCLIRQVPDAEARVKAKDGRVDLEGATMALDGMDEYGVEQALRIGGDALVGVALGPVGFETAIRRALAMGLTRAVHVETGDYVDTVTQARVLAQIVQAEKPDLVFCGGQHADTDSQALGAALAEALNWPSITWTTELVLENGLAKATHDVDDGKETLEVALPAVITCQQGLNEPRYPTLPNIMKAKSKPIDKKSLADFGAGSSKVRVVSQEIQERARLNKLIDGKDPVAAAEQLVKLLHEEAKVIRMILIVAEFETGKLKKATLELISAARGLGSSGTGKDGGVTALLLGPNAGSVAEETAKYADQVLIASDANLEPFVPSVIAQAIQQIALEGEAHTILLAGSRAGREVAPRLAVRLDAPYLEDAVKLEGIDGGLRMMHYAYLARVTETLEATAPVIVATVKPNTQTPAEATGSDGEIFEVELEITASSVKILGRTQEKSSRVPLTEATVVVTGGRGMGSPENFALIEALADVVGAGVGATRAAVDAGWRPYAEQVGQTGKTVQPNVYICAGVSGAVQHLSGMGKSKFIVAINKDAEAPIFKVADYGIIGDLNTILPAMIEAAKKLRD